MKKNAAPGPSKDGTASVHSARSAAVTFVDPTETGNFVIVPPDGGWGWVIVVAAFICNMLCDGVTYCFGIFMEDIANDLNCSLTDVAITTSVLTATYYLMGPLFCALTNRFGFRIVCMAGSVISVSVLVSSAYAVNLFMLIIIMGAVGGSAFSMIYITSIIIVGFYFERWRAMATAISVTGSAVGVVIVPQIIGLLDSFTWRQQFLFLSLGFVTTFFCGVLYRPLKPVEIVEVEREGADALTVKSNRSRGIDQASLNSDGNERFFIGTGRANRFHNKMFPTAAEAHGSGSFVISHGTVHSGHHFKPRKRSLESNKTGLTETMPTHSMLSRSRSIAPTRPLYRDDIFYQGSVTGLQQYHEHSGTQLNEAGGKHAPSYDYHMTVTRMPTTTDIAEQAHSKCICCPQSVKRILATMFDVNLLKQKSFTVFMFSGFFTVVGLYVPYIYIVDMNIKNDVEESQARFLLSVIGFSNAIGRIGCGMISLTSKLKAIICMEICLIICGISVVLLPFFTTLPMQYLCASIFGLTNAANAALRSIAIVDLYGLENLTNAFGIAVLFQGLACCIGLPVSGVLKEKTGSYIPVMLFAGCSIIISGVLIIPIPFMNRRERKKALDKITKKQDGTGKIAGTALGTK